MTGIARWRLKAAKGQPQKPSPVNRHPSRLMRAKAAAMDKKLARKERLMSQSGNESNESGVDLAKGPSDTANSGTLAESTPEATDRPAGTNETGDAEPTVDEPAPPTASQAAEGQTVS